MSDSNTATPSSSTFSSLSTIGLTQQTDYLSRRYASGPTSASLAPAAAASCHLGVLADAAVLPIDGRINQEDDDEKYSPPENIISQLQISNETMSSYEHVERLGGGSYGSVALFFTSRPPVDVAVGASDSSSSSSPPPLLHRLSLDGRFHVAIKQFPATTKPKEYWSELLAVSHLLQIKFTHPNVVKYYRIVHETNDAKWKDYAIVMEPGGDRASACTTLEDYIVQNSSRSLHAKQIHAIAKQLISGLSSLHHGANIIHRDLAPRNILVTKDEEGNVILKIMDFSRAKYLPGSEVTHSTFKTQSAHVDSRLSEQVVSGEGKDGEYTKVVDLYSIGVCLFECMRMKIFRGIGQAGVREEFKQQRNDLCKRHGSALVEIVDRMIHASTSLHSPDVLASDFATDLDRLNLRDVGDEEEVSSSHQNTDKFLDGTRATPKVRINQFRTLPSKTQTLLYHIYLLRPGFTRVVLEGLQEHCLHVSPVHHLLDSLVELGGLFEPSQERYTLPPSQKHYTLTQDWRLTLEKLISTEVSEDQVHEWHKSIASYFLSLTVLCPSSSDISFYNFSSLSLWSADRTPFLPDDLQAKVQDAFAVRIEVDSPGGASGTLTNEPTKLKYNLTVLDCFTHYCRHIFLTQDPTLVLIGLQYLLPTDRILARAKRFTESTELALLVDKLRAKGILTQEQIHAQFRFRHIREKVTQSPLEGLQLIFRWLAELIKENHIPQELGKGLNAEMEATEKICTQLLNDSLRSKMVKKMSPSIRIFPILLDQSIGGSLGSMEAPARVGFILVLAIFLELVGRVVSNVNAKLSEKELRAREILCALAVSWHQNSGVLFKRANNPKGHSTSLNLEAACLEQRAKIVALAPSPSAPSPAAAAPVSLSSSSASPSMDAPNPASTAAVIYCSAGDAYQEAARVWQEDKYFLWLNYWRAFHAYVASVPAPDNVDVRTKIEHCLTEALTSMDSYRNAGNSTLPPDMQQSQDEMDGHLTKWSPPESFADSGSSEATWRRIERALEVNVARTHP